MLYARISPELDRDRRGRSRRSVALGVHTRTADGGHQAVIRNLSENGLMLETQANLNERDIIECVLPNTGECTAEIVWVRRPNYGCRFFTPISKADVSATILASPLRSTDAEELERATRLGPNGESWDEISSLYWPVLTILGIVLLGAIALVIALVQLTG